MNNQQETPQSTQQSSPVLAQQSGLDTRFDLDTSNHDGTAPVLHLRQHKPEFLLKVYSTESEGPKELLRILPNGDILAKDLESASEAGKVFIESMTMHGKPLLGRIQELEEENELLKQKIETYEVRKGNQVY